jgi:acyl dehydratase
MTDLYFEDFRAGDVLDFAADRPVTKDEIVAFARAYDPQSFHLDEEAAKHSMLGGLAASGWHSCAILMRLNYDHWLNRTASVGAPGIDEVRWAKPVRPGDRLHVRRTILDTRVSASRPQIGLVHMSFEVANGAGEGVMTQRHSQMIELRHPPKAAPATEPAATPPETSGATDAPAEDGGLFTAFFEDLKVGPTRELGRETFTKEAIIAFAREYDPQPFHVDEAAARRSPYGALIASGWHTASLWMRNAVLTRDRAQRERTAKGLPNPPPGPSPGFTNLRWIKPVHAGDTITYASRVLEKRPTSRSGWGLIFADNSGTNQHGERVYECRGSAFVAMRGKD